MAKLCIICGGKAGSGEHVFPAALGGRRICNSIYCGPHNEGFSPLVAGLSKQFDEINALLAVRPDHAKTPRTATVADPNGDAVQLTAKGALSAADEPPLTKISLRFGGEEGLRAIGYIALTFLARYFPQVASYGSLAPFKDYIGGGPAAGFVWWEGAEPPAGIAKHPFRFGHTIALQVSASSQSAYAFFSLYSALNFAVAFGPAAVAVDESMTVHIDPQAELPNDLVEHRAAGQLFAPFGPSPGTQNLRRMVQDKSGQGALQNLFSDICHWNLLNATQPLYDELRLLCGCKSPDRREEVVAVLRQNPSLVYRLLEYCVEGLRKQFADMPQILAELDRIIERDRTSSTGLSPVALACLEHGINTLAAAIDAELCDATFDVDRLAMLTAGGPGAHIVCTAVISPILGAKP